MAAFDEARPAYDEACTWKADRLTLIPCGCGKKSWMHLRAQLVRDKADRDTDSRHLLAFKFSDLNAGVYNNNCASPWALSWPHQVSSECAAYGSVQCT